MGSKLCTILREQRKKADMSASIVIEKLATFDIKISEKTLYSYETGYRMLDADTLMALCEIYNIKNIMSVFGYSEKAPASICEAGDSIKGEIVEIYEELNGEGQNLMLEHAHFLGSQGKYKKHDTDGRLA